MLFDRDRGLTKALALLTLDGVDGIFLVITLGHFPCSDLILFGITRGFNKSPKRTRTHDNWISWPTRLTHYTTASILSCCFKNGFL
jgi:hypothetical protein